jgi:hypothetical protein
MSAYYEPGYSELLVLTNQFDKYELKFRKMRYFFPQIANPFITNFRIKRTYFIHFASQVFGYNELISRKQRTSPNNEYTGSVKKVYAKMSNAAVLKKKSLLFLLPVIKLMMEMRETKMKKLREMN